LASAFVVFAIVCVTCDDRLSTQIRAQRFPSVIYQFEAFSTPLSLLYGSRHCRQCTATTSLTFAEPPTRTICYSFTSVCIEPSSSAHRRPAVLTCTSFIPSQITLRSRYYLCYLSKPASNSTGPHQTLAKLLSLSEDGPSRRPNASNDRT
jgi:hypothetical protein